MNKKILSFLVLLITFSLGAFYIYNYVSNLGKLVGARTGVPRVGNLTLSEGEMIVGNSSGIGEATTTVRTDEDGNFYNRDLGLLPATSDWMDYSEETVLADFSDVASWVKGSAGVLTNDTTSFVKASTSLKLATYSDSTRVQARKSSISPTLNIRGKHIKAWVKIDKPESLDGMKIWFSSDNFASAYASIETSITTQGDRYVRPNYWTQITFNLEEMTAVGNVNWEAINSMQVTCEDDTTATTTCSFGGISAFDKANNGVISFVFDDGAVSQYTEARKKMSQYGFPGTAYIIPDYIDTNVDYMTLSQLRDLQNFNGWDVASHGTDNLTEISTSSAEKELLNTKTWLIRNGFTRGVDHYAYPNGGWNEDTVLPLVRKYFTSARTIFTGLGTETLPINDPHKLRPVYITNVTATSTVYTAIDNCKLNNLWCILTFHKIVTTPTVSTEYSINGFGDIVNYAYSSGLPVKTVSDVFNSFNPNFVEIKNNSVGIGTSSPLVPLQVTTKNNNATTTLEVGKIGQNKGSCLKLYNNAGTATYCSLSGTTFACSATSCQ